MHPQNPDSSYISSRKALLCLAAGFCTLIIAMGVGRFVYNPLLPGMMSLHGFGPITAGTIAAWNYAGYLAGALIMRGIADPKKRYVFFAGWMFLSLTTTAGMGFAQGETTWYAVRFLSGLASGALFVLGSAMVFDTLNKAHRSGLAGFLYSGVGTGIALSGTLAPLYETYFGNSSAWVGIGLTCAPLALFSLLFIRPDFLVANAFSAGNTRATPAHSLTKNSNVAEATATATAKITDKPTPPHPTPAKADIAVANSSRATTARRFLNIAYFLEGLGYIISATFLVTMVKESTGSLFLANAAWALTGATAACLTPLWPLMARRTGYPKALILAFLLQSAGILLPVLSASPWAALCGGLLFGGTFLGITVLCLQYGVSLSDKPSSHTIGTMTVIYGIGQILGPIMAGYLGENAGFALSFTLSAGCTVLGSAAVALGSRCSK